MDDVIFVGLFVVMMSLSFGYIKLCARIVGEPEASAVEHRQQ